MTRPNIAEILSTDTFGVLLARTNNLIELITDDVVFASANIAYASTGNINLTGDIAASTLTAASAKITNLENPDNIANPVVSLSPLRVTTNAALTAEFISPAGKPAIHLTNAVDLSWSIEHESDLAGTSLFFKVDTSATAQASLSQAGVLAATSFVGSGSAITSLSPGNFAAGNLLIRNADAAELELLSTDSVSSRIRFADVADANVGQIFYDHPTDEMRLIAANSIKLRINAAGTVLGQTSGNATGALLSLRKSRGTDASPSVLAVSDVLGEITFQGYNGSAFVTGADIKATATTATGTFDTNVSYTANTHTIKSGATTVLTVASNTNVGIGTATPTSKLHVVGDVSATNFNSLSDVAFKKEIAPIDFAMDILNKIIPVSFNWKENNRKSYGVIAQDIEKIMPELINIDNDGTKSVQYIPLIAILIQAIQNQHKDIEILKKQI